MTLFPYTTLFRSDLYFVTRKCYVCHFLLFILSYFGLICGWISVWFSLVLALLWRTIIAYKFRSLDWLYWTRRTLTNLNNFLYHKLSSFLFTMLFQNLESRRRIQISCSGEKKVVFELVTYKIKSLKDEHTKISLLVWCS